MPKTELSELSETPETDPRDAELAELKRLLAELVSKQSDKPQDPSLTEKPKSTEQQLDESEKISVRLPVNPAEKKKHVLVVINGHRSLVPVGRTVSVPRPIYEQLVVSGIIGAEEGDEHLEPQWTIRSKDGSGDEV